MIDLRGLREDPESFRRALVRRDARLSERVDAILERDAARRELIKVVEAKKADRNAQSEEVARLKKAKADADELVGRLQVLSREIKDHDHELADIENALHAMALRIPNIPLDEVPVGDPTANRLERTWGQKPAFAFAPKAHWDIGDHLGLFDFPRAAKITGSGFALFTGVGARLVRGLVNFMLDTHTTKHGYREVWPPSLVNADSAQGTGQLPDFDDQMYVTQDDLYLVPTAEVPVTNIHRDDVLPEDALPMGYAAYSPCFRREAGAHGKDTRGLTRVHQFDKVELVRFVRPEDSPEELKQLLGHAEVILQLLELPYRIVTLATGDLGFASAKTYDIEVWAPGADAWLEVSSASTFTDFQARRANIRYKSKSGGKPQFVHTLNASGIALPRTIIALLENHQQPDGSVRVPDALVPYLGMEHLSVNDT